MKCHIWPIRIADSNELCNKSRIKHNKLYSTVKKPPSLSIREKTTWINTIHSDLLKNKISPKPASPLWKSNCPLAILMLGWATSQQQLQSEAWNNRRLVFHVTVEKFWPTQNSFISITLKISGPATTCPLLDSYVLCLLSMSFVLH